MVRIVDEIEIGVDCESADHIPFLGTVSTRKGKSGLFRLEDIHGKDKESYIKFKAICESDKYIKVFHNAPADIFWLKRIGINVNKFECSLIASTFVNELLKAVKLSVLVKEYLGFESKKDTILKRLITKYKNKAKKLGVEFKWNQLPREELEACALDDSWQSLELWKIFKPRIQKYYKTYLFEKKICRIVVWMMSNRMLINRELAIEKAKEYKEKRKIYYDKIRLYLRNVKYEGWQTIRLHPQVKENGLRDVLKFLNIETGRTEPTKSHLDGQVASDAKALSKHFNNPFIQLLFRWRFYEKHYNTYYYPLAYEYTNNKDSYAIFMAYQTGAKTGRFTYALFQTLPRPGESKKSEENNYVRHCVIPEKGRELWCFDMEQEEARIFASYANCERMLGYFNNGIDPYIGGAYDIFGEDVVNESEKMKKIYRQIAKKPTLGITYGEGPEKLLSSLTVDTQESVPQDVWEKLGLDNRRAFEILEKYHMLYPEIKPYMQSQIREVYFKGGIEIELKSDHMDIYRFYNIPKDKAYIAVNKRVQGSAAYVLKYAMLYSTQYIFKNKLQKDILLDACIHDELKFRSRIMEKSERHEHIMNIKKSIEDHSTFKVPLLSSIKTSTKSWGDIKTYVPYEFN